MTRFMKSKEGKQISPLLERNSSVMGAGKVLRTVVCGSKSKGKLGLAPIAESRGKK